MRDDEHVSGAKDLAEIKGLYEGEWIDDGDVLKQQWKPGMDIRAVNYCTDKENGWFTSLQLMVGSSEEEDPDQWIKLRKHGAAGGSCYRWTLQSEDYIRRVQYTWNNHHMQIVEVVFQSHNGQTRVIGLGEGRKVNYEYSAFQPLVGFFSFDAEDGKLFAIGAYEDDCHNTPERLPYGFLTSNIPSLEEVRGEASIASVSWVNESSGTSAGEIEIIETIIEQEHSIDAKIEEPLQETMHIENTDFIDIDITIINETNIQTMTPAVKSGQNQDAAGKAMLVKNAEKLEEEVQFMK